MRDGKRQTGEGFLISPKNVWAFKLAQQNKKQLQAESTPKNCFHLLHKTTKSAKSLSFKSGALQHGRRETGDVRQGTLDRRWETGYGRQGMVDRRQEKGDGKQEKGDNRQDMEDRRLEMRD